MTASITIRLEDLGAARKLAEAGRQLSDLTPLMRRIASSVEEATRIRFTQGKGPGGVPWAPSQRARETGGQTLIDERRLINSITSRSDATTAEVGTNVIYAGTHQFGAAQGEFGAAIGRTKPSEKRPKSQDFFVPLPFGDIPARPFLGIDEGDEREIGALVDEFLAGLVA